MKKIILLFAILTLSISISTSAQVAQVSGVQYTSPVKKNLTYFDGTALLKSISFLHIPTSTMLQLDTNSVFSMSPSTALIDGYLSAQQRLQISKNQNRMTSLLISNTNTTTAAGTAIMLQQGTTSYILMKKNSTGYTSSGADLADAGILASSGNGGLNLLAGAAAKPVRIYAGGAADSNLVVTFQTGQILNIAGVPKFSGTQTTGTVTPTLGTNAPTGVTTPKKYVKVYLSDGTAGYIQVW